ncbi:MAG TPA: deiodinase-like protein [Vicinamibacteria bacterium]|nr:deiodinase-like protein [Vicinamibacteria bacterium]
MRRLKAVAPWIFGAIALFYVGSAGVVFAVMHQSNTVAGKGLSMVPGPAFMVLPMETMWVTARRGKLAVGQEAPDFDLAMRDGSSRVRLSSLRGGRPVVLIFGSYTCPPFRREMPEVRKVYADYKDRAAFYFVYIEEAHAHDVWPLVSNAKANIVFGTARDAGERVTVAGLCEKELKVEFPILVDDMQNDVADAYTAWPTRMYVVDANGKIAYKSRVGPFGFEAAPLREALARLAPAPKGST